MKKLTALILSLTLALSLTACVAKPAAPAETKAPETEAATEAPAPETEAPETEAPAPEGSAVNLFVLSGPTGIGALNLWEKAEAGETANDYHVTLTAANDEIVAAISNGEADIAAVATNLASTLYNKTQGGVSVLAVNTLGVLSILGLQHTSQQTLPATVADMKGMTIYAPGQGANPEYILRYVLSGNGLDADSDLTVNFVAEGSELLTVWEQDPDALILAPQPVATTLLMQNEGSEKLFDMTEEWASVAGGESTLMMGCVIVNNTFLSENPEAVAAFMEEYKASIEAAQSDVEGTAALAEKRGIIPKAPLAMKAIPQCGLTFVSGEDMKAQLGGYLNVMFEANPKSVGGALPGDDFYYLP